MVPLAFVTFVTAELFAAFYVVPIESALRAEHSRETSMFWRNAALAGAAAMIASLAVPAQADAAQPARCEEMNLRVYFDHDSARLNQAARDTLAAAQRNISDCTYAELHVSANPGPLQVQRGRAILAAMHGRNWDVARVERQQMAQVASYGGPDYMEVLMTPNHVPAAPALNEQGAGV